MRRDRGEHDGLALGVLEVGEESDTITVTIVNLLAIKGRPHRANLEDELIAFNCHAVFHLLLVRFSSVMIRAVKCELVLADSLLLLPSLLLAQRWTTSLLDIRKHPVAGRGHSRHSAHQLLLEQALVFLKLVDLVEHALLLIVCIVGNEIAAVHISTLLLHRHLFHRGQVLLDRQLVVRVLGRARLVLEGGRQRSRRLKWPSQLAWRWQRVMWVHQLLKFPIV